MMNDRADELKTENWNGRSIRFVDHGGEWRDA
jgi:hypothetical protein